jgi:hypothetical protein
MIFRVLITPRVQVALAVGSLSRRFAEFQLILLPQRPDRHRMRQAPVDMLRQNPLRPV